MRVVNGDGGGGTCMEVLRYIRFNDISSIDLTTSNEWRYEGAVIMENKKKKNCWVIFNTFWRVLIFLIELNQFDERRNIAAYKFFFEIINVQ